MEDITEEKFGTLSDDLMQGLSVVWILRYRFAERPALTSPVVHGQSKMVCGDGTRDCIAQFLHAVDGGASRGVFEHDA